MFLFCSFVEASLGNTWAHGLANSGDTEHNRWPVGWELGPTTLKPSEICRLKTQKPKGDRNEGLTFAGRLLSTRRPERRTKISSCRGKRGLWIAAVDVKSLFMEHKQQMGHFPSSCSSVVVMKESTWGRSGRCHPSMSGLGGRDEGFPLLLLPLSPL